jgi:hypothetical protein
MNEHLLLSVNDFGAVLKNSFPSAKSGTIGKYRPTNREGAGGVA